KISWVAFSEAGFDGWMQYADADVATIAGKAHRNGPLSGVLTEVRHRPGRTARVAMRERSQAYRPTPPTRGNALVAGRVEAMLSTSVVPPNEGEDDEAPKLLDSCRCCCCWPTIASPSAMPCPASASRSCGIACCTASRTCACAAKKCACATWSLTCRLITRGPSSLGCRCSSI